jgi:diadenosine tetraphosphatase ApaH/serine/threonine PP2A family protein phosphatase
MNPMAQESILWTRKRLTEESRQYLKTRPPTIVTDEIIFAHASPWNPLRWRYVMENEDAQRVFFSTRQKILFIGHTHFSRVITQGVFSAVFEDPSACSLIYTGGNKRFIVNCGSVGQPRDEDPRASYVIHDTERKTLLFRRVEYDCSRAAEKILDAGLPEFLASRLFKGI